MRTPSNLASLLDLAKGFTLGRVVSVATLLVFSAVTGPEPFAAFGVYLATCNVLWVVASGRYEHALFAADDAEMRSLVWLSAIVASVAGIAVILISVALLMLAPALPAGLEQSAALAFLGLSVAGRAASRIVLNLATRVRKFDAFSRAMLAQALVQGALQLGLLLFDWRAVTCLAAADAVGYCAATLIAALRMRGHHASLRGVPSRHDLAAAARHWRQMPAWNMPTALVSVAAVSLPGFALPLALPVLQAGSLLFAMRVLELPWQLMTSTATPILQHEFRGAPQHALVARNGALWLLWCSLAIFGLLAIASVVFSGLFAGTRWQLAVGAVPWLALYYVGLTVSGPLVDLVPGLRAEPRASVVHSIFFLGMLLGACLLLQGWSGQQVLLVWSAAALVRAALFARLLMREA